MALARLLSHHPVSLRSLTHSRLPALPVYATVAMGFGLYSLILVGILFTNSVAIINERFLKQCQPRHNTATLHPAHPASCHGRRTVGEQQRAEQQVRPWCLLAFLSNYCACSALSHYLPYSDRPVPCCVVMSVGLERPTADSPQSVKNRILTLLYGDVKLLLQMPLIWINLVTIVLLILLG